MSTYKYEALNTQGVKVKGEMDGETKQEIISSLKNQKFYPINIVEVSSVNSGASISLPFGGKVTSRDLSIYTRQFYTMLNAGITLVSALEVLKIQSENRRLKVATDEIYNDVRKGLSFSDALKKQEKVFPELFAFMVEAGEMSGNLDGIMDRMASHYEKDAKLSGKIKSAMTYPIVLGIAMVSVMILMLTVVMPSMMSMFEGKELPAFTQTFINISDVFVARWYLIIGGFIGIIYLVKSYFKSEQGRPIKDNLILKMPVIGKTQRKILTSRFTRTLSTLLTSGVGLVQSLEVIAKVVNNKVLEKGILDAIEEMKKGSDIASPLEKANIFPPMVISMIRIGEESGALDSILDKTADFFDAESESALQRLTTLIEPAMTLLMAVLVGTMVIAMILPIFEMVNNF
jgi:type IV pilus assembly protein PilC